MRHVPRVVEDAAMGWAAVAALNVVIVGCYLAISMTIFLGLRSTQQLLTNRLAVATGVIFLTCALHHGHHAAHLIDVNAQAGQTAALRAAFGSVHTVVLDLVGAVVAVVYLALRSTYGTLLNTPAMFDDQVRLATEERLRALAYVDALTGCGNRAAYEQLVDELDGSAEPVSVVFLDLDRFKSVNDTYGHEAGDRVLRLTGERLSAAAREGERTFRLGGDEFVVVRVGGDDASAQELAERCRELVSEPIAMREGDLVRTASAGWAHGAVQAGLQHLLREADQRMYAAKRAHHLPHPRGQAVVASGAAQA